MSLGAVLLPSHSYPSAYYYMRWFGRNKSTSGFSQLTQNTSSLSIDSSALHNQQASPVKAYSYYMCNVFHLTENGSQKCCTCQGIKTLMRIPKRTKEKKV